MRAIPTSGSTPPTSSAGTEAARGPPRPSPPSARARAATCARWASTRALEMLSSTALTIAFLWRLASFDSSFTSSVRLWQALLSHLSSSSAAAAPSGDLNMSRRSLFEQVSAVEAPVLPGYLGELCRLRLREAVGVPERRVLASPDLGALPGFFSSPFLGRPTARLGPPLSLSLARRHACCVWQRFSRHFGCPVPTIWQKNRRCLRFLPSRASRPCPSSCSCR